MRNLWVVMLCGLMVGCGTCGENNGMSNNGTSNNQSNSQTNNQSNNQSNSQTNDGTNVATNNQTNNGTNAGTNNQTTNNGPTEIAADELAQAFHDMLCEASWECPNRSTAELSLIAYGRFESLEACKDAEPEPRIVTQMGLREIAASAEAGRLDYDATKAAECIAAIKAQVCDPNVPSPIGEALPVECIQALQGTVAEGGDCIHELDCLGGLRCETTGMNCYGTCQTPAPDCATDRCTDAEYCDSTNTCQPRKAAGEMCASDEECADGTTCNSSITDPVCVEDGSIAGGETCDNTSSCEAGFVCSSDVCQPLEFGAENDDCGPISTGGIALCEPGLVCLVSGIPMGTCLPPIELGGSCDNIQQCAAKLACVANECATPLADGLACSSDEVCASQNCNAANVCETPDACMLP